MAAASEDRIGEGAALEEEEISAEAAQVEVGDQSRFFKSCECRQG